MNLNIIWKYIIGTMAGALILYGVIFLFVGDPRYLVDSKKQIKELQVRIDSIQNVQHQLDKRLDSISQKDSVLFKNIENNNSSINANEKQLQNIQKKYHEKISSVDNYNDDDVNRFLTERYGNRP